MRDIPESANSGKMLIYGALLQCLDPILTIAAAIAYGRSVFISPQQNREEADAARQQIIGPSIAAKSDHISTVNAFNQYQQIRRDESMSAVWQWCKKSFVSFDAMKGLHDGRSELVKSLLELDLITQGVSPGTICVLL
jgi:HrpA-like RNA helicase